MATLRGTAASALVVWLSAFAGLAADARNPVGNRSRASRSVRLEGDHSDLTHEAEFHSLRAQYAHLVAADTPTDGSALTATRIILPRVERSGPAVSTPPTRRLIFRPQHQAQPRAPPASF